MFLPSAPAVITTTTPSPRPFSSSSPSTRRVKGLSLLRNYTQNLHLHYHPQGQPTSSSSPGSDTLSPGSNVSSISTLLSSPRGITSNPTPPGPPRPLEGQATSYFPTAAELKAITETPVELPTTSVSPVSSVNASEVPRRMARRRTSSLHSGPVGRRRPSSPTSPPDLGNNLPPATVPTPPILSPDEPPSTGPTPAANNESSGLSGLAADQMPTIKFIPHQDPRSSKPSLPFIATSRTLPHEDCVIRVGRYSERDANPNPPPNVPSSAPIGFKSKVVSRRHCEFWCSQGQWYIKDVKSSSGTFLNHIRLSQPSVESRPFPVNDGDVVQLGIDFRGGEEQIFRCVKIRIECNRAWQKGLNNFNMSTHKRLRALAKTTGDVTANATECSICLMSVAPCQSLFVAPCSHVWHFKCIRPILTDHQTYPQFLCPNCRAVTDLEAEVDELEQWEEEIDNVSITEEAHLEAEQSNTSANPDRTSMIDDDDMALSSSAHQLSITGGSQPVAIPGVSLAPPVGLGLGERTAQRSSPHAVTGSIGSSIDGFQPGPSHRGTAGSTPESVDQPRSAKDKRQAASPPNILDGPLTPQNTAGPYVFDGTAGRAGGISAALAAEETIIAGV